ncbi:protein kinase domain-containing protein [Ditylenchus destructor]|uniref:Protein kinase domain-containing protein n=1 Tax=Ditylenchus destructor TaxID=166010 RepID=A0AAD4NI61_9BILA|nr:protein kinase domain-containing protein [Ditylenchus destructor]
MGGRFSVPDSSRTVRSNPSETQLADFSLVRSIGRGAFGKVCIVEHRGMKTFYACKYMSKNSLIKNSVAHNVLRELELLRELSHPFIVNLYFTFQDEEFIYEVCDLLLGGDLRFHLNEQGRFSEERAKLYLCEIALALDYLHNRCQIVHRDIKPENILLDNDGHAHLTDFNLAIKLSPGTLANSFSGTRPYMAPEILMTALEQLPGYDFAVDFWALGVTFYEMIRGIRPYDFSPDFSSLQVLRLMSGNHLVLPSRWSSDLISFISSMLNYDLNKRIDTYEKLTAHHYLYGRMNLQKILDKQTFPVFVPRNNRLNCNSSRDLLERRTTNSSPLHLRLQRRQSKLRHPNHNPQQPQSSDANTFTEYNRFRRGSILEQDNCQKRTGAGVHQSYGSTQYPFRTSRDTTCSM